jgi:hypothetical protein
VFQKDLRLPSVVEMFRVAITQIVNMTAFAIMSGNKKIVVTVDLLQYW